MKSVSVKDPISMKGGKARAVKGLRNCYCPCCGQVVLSREMRIELGLDSELDLIGGKGGSKNFELHGSEGMSANGKMGGRGNTKAKRLAKEKMGVGSGS